MGNIKNDIQFVKDALSLYYYKVRPDKKHITSIRCTSGKGMGEENWGNFTNHCRSHFKERLSEFYHEVNYMHKDFIIYLKP